MNTAPLYSPASHDECSSIVNDWPYIRFSRCLALFPHRGLCLTSIHARAEGSGRQPGDFGFDPLNCGTNTDSLARRQVRYFAGFLFCFAHASQSVVSSGHTFLVSRQLLSNGRASATTQFFWLPSHSRRRRLLLLESLANRCRNFLLPFSHLQSPSW